MTIKKLSLLATAIAALALAVPALASAAPAWTMPAGTLLPVGTNVSATSSNLVIPTPVGTQKCQHTIITLQLSKNTGSSVAAAGVAAGTTKECQVTDLTVPSLTSTTSGSGTLAITFEIDITATVKCHLSGAAVPFTYAPGSSSINVKGALTGTGVCAGGSSISGDFAIETVKGGAVILD